MTMGSLRSTFALSAFLNRTVPFVFTVLVGLADGPFHSMILTVAGIGDPGIV
jgi:hypothetical protein